MANTFTILFYCAHLYYTLFSIHCSAWPMRVYAPNIFIVPNFTEMSLKTIGIDSCGLCFPDFPYNVVWPRVDSDPWNTDGTPSIIHASAMTLLRSSWHTTCYKKSCQINNVVCRMSYVAIFFSDIRIELASLHPPSFCIFLLPLNRAIMAAPLLNFFWLCTWFYSLQKSKQTPIRWT